MPLPDERPRASVANLIGRFEQQNKRHSLTPTNNSIPSRSPSVGSHITGDSVKEEVKEKREWPPPTAAVGTPLAPPAPIYASAFWSKPKSTPSTAPASTESSISDVTPHEPVKEELKPAEPSSQPEPPSSPTPQPQQTPMSPSAKARAAAARAKATSTPRSSLASTTTSSAVKPQHTGTKPKLPPSTPTSKTPRPSSSSGPKTPSSFRPKTPASSARPKTPASSTSTGRPKTPSSSTLRPKTPSSGLFAPTAASLAKARNAPQQPPPPTRKITLSTAAAERLGKPTAASLSKMRGANTSLETPVKASPSAAARAKTGAAMAKPRPSGTAGKVTSTPTKSSTARVPATTHKAATTNGNVHASTEERDPEPLHVESKSAAAEEVSEKHDEPVEEQVHDQEGSDAVVEHEEEEVVHVEEEAQEEREEEEVDQESHSQSEAEVAHSESPSEPSDSSSAPVHDDLVDNAPEEEEESTFTHPDHQGSPESAAGDDIEDIVKMLEFGKPRPFSIVDIPDVKDVHEIPDEE